MKDLEDLTKEDFKIALTGFDENGKAESEWVEEEMEEVKEELLAKTEGEFKETIKEFSDQEVFVMMVDLMKKNDIITLEEEQNEQD